MRYLTGYKRRNGTLPRNTTWAKALRGEEDTGGDAVKAVFECVLCGQGQRVLPVFGALVDEAERAGRAACDMVPGGVCGGRRRQEESIGPVERKEVPEKREHRDEDDRPKGYSAEAKQFYKNSGQFLPTPEYRGETSEADLLSWKRGVEKYFRAYGINEDREQVDVAADLLAGEARRWWNGLWMSGRDGEVEDWEQMLERLRERFLPLGGEMKIIGQWRRLQQVGTVAKYADYVFQLKALCEMDNAAEFKLAFYGLRSELQAKVREHLRQNGLQKLPLSKLFAIASDAELGLGLANNTRWGDRDNYPSYRGGRESGRGERPQLNALTVGKREEQDTRTPSGAWASREARAPRQYSDRSGWSWQTETRRGGLAGTRDTRGNWQLDRVGQGTGGGLPERRDSAGLEAYGVCDMLGHRWF